MGISVEFKMGGGGGGGGGDSSGMFHKPHCNQAAWTSSWSERSQISNESSVSV